MKTENLPDRGIDVPLERLQTRYDLTEVDVCILEELEKRPGTTGWIAERIDEQPGYVSQRLSNLRSEHGIVVQLRRGYYEVNALAMRSHSSRRGGVNSE